MTDLAQLCAELEATWRETIPLSNAIGLDVARFENDELTVRAPLEPNRNIHGTAFAGSLYSIAVLAGWGRVWLALRQRELQGRIVVADGRIDYRKAVKGEVRCRCTLHEDAATSACALLESAGRATLPIEATIGDPASPAVVFTGTYVILRGRE